MSSSMRNAIPRRSHRERSQPHARAQKGLLEKKKDYVLRAKDYAQKQRTLKRLSEKASERNPDEFYFGMMRERTEGGVAIAQRAESRPLSVAEVKPLKKQDGAYIRTMRSIESARIERLKGIVQNVEGNVKPNKILFAGDEGEGPLPSGSD